MTVTCSRVYLLFILFVTLPNNIVYTKQYAAASRKRCLTDLRVEWSREVGTSPFIGTPIITDINGDGKVDVVATSFAGEIHVIDGSTGRPVSHAQWPYKLAHSSVQSSPIQHDMDQDGDADILIVTAEGEILSFTQEGDPILQKSTKIEPLLVMKDWHLRELSANKGSIHDFILDNKDLSKYKTVTYIPVDPHVMANSIIADLNQDGVLEELVIPVSYYFDQHYYSSYENQDNLPKLEFDEMKNYLACSIILMNITSMEVMRTIHLELTTISSEYPGYLLYSPSIADLDSNGGPLEVIVGTSAGQVHAFDVDGNERKGFPIPTDTIHGQIAVEDVNRDGKLELVVVDVSSNVACYDGDGALVWESQVSGSSSSGARVTDVNGDGELEIIISSDDGKLWALKGQTGEVLQGWPMKIGQKLYAPPLLTRLNEQTMPTIISLADDGSLHMIRASDKCRLAVSLGEMSRAGILSHDLIPSVPGLEFLVATQDGTLMCLSQKDKTSQLDQLTLYAWSSELHNANNFIFHNGRYGVLLHEKHSLPKDHTSSSFDVKFSIVDNTTVGGSEPSYKINIYIGSVLFTEKVYKSSGSYSLNLKSPSKPLDGWLRIVLTNTHGQRYSDSMPIRFHEAVMDDLKWLLVGPMIGMSLTLLFVYGFPTSDLLPTSMPVKDL